TKRATQGVRIINLLEDHIVSTVALVDADIEDESQEIDETYLETSDVEETSEKEIYEDIKQMANNDIIDDEDEGEDLESDEDNDEIDDILNDSY
ncbi:MAG TPA: hypothetical protein PKU69_00745, partial [Bacillota bacterium]|nr:hypothetical protein [Bacillota bacterium]